VSILRLIDHHFITYYDGRIQHRHREAAFFTFVIAPLFTFVIAPLFTFVIARPKAAAILSAADRLLRFARNDIFGCHP